MVTVDGVTVTELGTRVDPTAEIRVDGKMVRAEAPRYILLNKPAGFITTTSDDKGRETVMNLVDARERVYPVGRLDRDTEGLILLTNDGDVAHRVMHPRYKLAKEYTILTSVRPTEHLMARVRDGIEIDRRKVVPDEFRIQRETRDGVLLAITVHEGLNRVVRRMMEEVGIPIARLWRVRIGPLSLGSIAVGGSRDLTGGELTSLLQALQLDRADAPQGGAAAKSGRPKSARRGGPPYAGRRPPSSRALEPVAEERAKADLPATGSGPGGRGRPPEPNRERADSTGAGSDPSDARAPRQNAGKRPARGTGDEPEAVGGDVHAVIERTASDNDRAARRRRDAAPNRREGSPSADRDASPPGERSAEGSVPLRRERRAAERASRRGTPQQPEDAAAPIPEPGNRGSGAPRDPAPGKGLPASGRRAGRGSATSGRSKDRDRG